MTKPLRIQRTRKAGWRMPADTVYVGRPTHFGNPFNTAEDFRNMHATVGHAELLPVDVLITVGDDDAIYECATLSRIKAELRGKNLACWCALDKPCHADVLLELANE